MNWTKEHGEALRERRHRRGLSQEMLAETAGVTEKTIRLLEHAASQPRPSTLQLVAEALGTDIHELVDGYSFPSVAVLPFVNISDDPTQEYFCDGLAEELINALVHVRGLKVVARTSSFRFRGSAEDARTIGRALGVQHLVEGSVRRSIDRLRICAQLIRTDDGSHLWSETFDRQAADIFDIQDEISLVIVDRLRGELLDGEQQRLTKRHTRNEQAYQHYLVGRFLYQRMNAHDLDHAIGEFERAIALDPSYAPAFEGVAACYCTLAFWGWRDPRTAIPTAKQATAKALANDPELAAAHARAAYASLHFDWDWPAAKQSYDRAVELSPSESWPRMLRASALSAMGRFGAALDDMRRASILDPLSPYAHALTGAISANAGREQESLKQLHRALALDEGFALTHSFLAQTYIALNRSQDAIAAAERFAALAGQPGFLAYICAREGQRDRALSLLEEHEARAAERYVSPWHRAGTYGALGEIDLAMEAVEQALEVREPQLVTIKTGRAYDCYRGQQWFEDVVDRVGLWGERDRG